MADGKWFMVDGSRRRRICDILEREISNLEQFLVA